MSRADQDAQLARQAREQTEFCKGLPMTAPAALSHETRSHSVLGASGADRWVACPGSIRMSVGKPDEESIYAAEGTAAHELAEWALNKACAFLDYADHQDTLAECITAADRIGDSITVGNHTFTVDEEMAEAVQLYVDVIMADFDPLEGDRIMIEKQFDLSALYPGMFGTNDACIYKAARSRLIVYDFKYGKGKAVEVKDNKQLRYYGLGAAREVAGLADIEIVVVQPRAPHKDGPVRRDAPMTAMELIDWAADLVDAAERTADPDAPLVAGDHCRWCRAEQTCSALREAADDAAMADFAGAPADLADDDMVGILDRASMIESWVAAVRKEAFSRLCAGQGVGDWKLVAKRGRRYWLGDDETIADFVVSTLSVDRADIVEQKLRSPAQVEKLLSKSDKQRLAEFYETRSSGITMARGSDRRPAVDAATAAEADFDPVED